MFNKKVDDKVFFNMTYRMHHGICEKVTQITFLVTAGTFQKIHHRFTHNNFALGINDLLPGFHGFNNFGICNAVQVDYY